jgi:hypothetical protein
MNKVVVREIYIIYRWDEMLIDMKVGYRGEQVQKNCTVKTVKNREYFFRGERVQIG